VASILGETDGGLSNREIEELLASANIADPKARAERASPLVQAGHAFVKMSKAERIRRALTEHQGRTGTGQALVGFLHAALRPQRYVESPALFTIRRDRLNEVLAFDGLELREDGRLHRRSRPARTIAEAAAMASTMTTELRRRDTHPNVLAHCRAEVLSKNNFHASLEATKGVFDRLRRELQIEGDGAALIDTAFGFKSGIPRLALNTLRSDTERSEQTGFMNLLKGLYSMYRTPTAHDAKVTREIARPITESELMELFTTLSMVHRRLDRCSRPGAGGS
jgi:uncharacterized protein (TIGR02391 family)